MPPATITAAPTAPDPNALASIARRVPVPSPLNTAEWEDLPIGLRESALFSATLESARALDRIDLRLREAVAGLRRTLDSGAEGAVAGRSSFINELRQIMIDEGLMPIDGSLGSIKDLTSENRLKLIFDTQVDRAIGYAGWKAEQNSAVLNAAPAQELIRIGRRRAPRDWLTRWRNAGGSFYGGRMIAAKDDPVWGAISRFGTPWPPFDFNSGMGLRDVLRREAIQLGVIKPSEQVKPQPEAKFTQGLQADASKLSPAALDYLKSTLGDRITIAGGAVKWKGAA